MAFCSESEMALLSREEEEDRSEQAALLPSSLRLCRFCAANRLWSGWCLKRAVKCEHWKALFDPRGMGARSQLNGGGTPGCHLLSASEGRLG